MNNLLAAAALVQAAYGFGAGDAHTYDVVATFDGFIPFGEGLMGEVQVDLDMDVRGLEPRDDLLRASSELTDSVIKLDGFELPFGLEAVQDFFPKTTIGLTPYGRIETTDAPDVRVPFRLPGLDVKRFPDITYVPIRLPEEGLTEGTTWSFEKPFGASPIAYECEVVSIAGQVATIAVRVEQSFETLENAAFEVTEDEARAKWRVRTEMEGAGTVVFDLERGLAQAVDMRNVANSVATDVNTGATQNRPLTVTLKVRLEGAQARTAQPKEDDSLIAQGRRLWETGRALWPMVRVGVSSAWRNSGGDFATFLSSLGSLFRLVLPTGG